MKTIYALSGPPGAGKTTLRQTDEHLKDLPCIDVASIYQEFDGITPKVAFAELLRRVEVVLEQENTVIVEAMLPPNHWQRDWLSYIAEMNETTLEYIDLHDVSYDECRRRVKANYADDASKASNYAERHYAMARYKARMEILDAYEKQNTYGTLQSS